jgi:hypothetical protein
MNLKDKTLLIAGIGDFTGLRTAEIALSRGPKTSWKEYFTRPAETIL